MSKKKFFEVDPKIRSKMLNDFYEMVSRIGDKKNARNFFKDLLTPGESIMIVYRIEIAKMLLEGFGYDDVQRKLNVGANTVSAVNKWLYAGFGGYVKELKKAQNQTQRRAVLPTTEWGRIKNKYPAHFLLFNLLDKKKK
jgi:uncharacterized protein YerC